MISGLISGPTLWWMIVVMGVGALVLRGIFLFARPSQGLPAGFQRALRLAPAAIFSALVVPAVFGASSNPNGLDPHWVVAGLAVLIAWRTRSMLPTIGGGMVALWLLTWWLG